MKTYKLLITDLDGTAVPVAGESKDIDDITTRLARQVKDSGKLISIATGRDFRQSVKDIALKLSVDSPIIVDGGSQIIDPVTEEVVWEQHLSEVASTNILAIFSKLCPSEAYVKHEDNSQGHKREMARSIIPRQYRFLFLIGITDTFVAQTIADEINQASEIEAEAHVTPCWMGPGFVDVHVTHPEGTKEYGVKKLIEILGIDKDQTIGIGDSGNDVPLLRGVGLGVAVGDASHVLKELSDYVAPNQSDGALAHVIEEYLL